MCLRASDGGTHLYSLGEGLGSGDDYSLVGLHSLGEHRIHSLGCVSHMAGVRGHLVRHEVSQNPTPTSWATSVAIVRSCAR